MGKALQYIDQIQNQLRYPVYRYETFVQYAYNNVIQ